MPQHNTNLISKSLIKEFNKRFYIDENFKLLAKIKYSNNIKVGQEVGRLAGGGYRQVRVFRICYQVHRVIWSMYYGKPPKKDLDHIDRNRINNNPKNMREFTNQQNQMNTSMRKDNTSGVRGVNFSKAKDKWVARIWKNKKAHYLGDFYAKKYAEKARRKAEIEMGFTNE